MRVLLVLAVLPLAGPAVADPPNIVLILADDMGHGRGDSRGKAPGERGGGQR